MSIVFPSACSSIEELEKKGEIISVDLSQDHIQNPFTLCSEIKYIPLETFEGNFMGNIEKIIPYQDRFYLMNGSHIMVFNDEGKFLFRIHERGSGPGEYISIEDFLIDKKNNRLELFDRANKILQYDLDGNFIKEKRVEFLCIEFSKLPNGEYICNSGGTNIIDGKPVQGNLLHLSQNFDLLANYLPPISLQEAEIKLQGILTPSNPLGLMTCWLSPTIYRIIEGAPQPLFTLDFGEFNPPSELLYHATYDEMEKDIRAILTGPYAKTISQLVETETLISCMIFLGQEKKQILIDKETGNALLIPPHMIEEEIYQAPLYYNKGLMTSFIQPYILLEEANYEKASGSLKKILDTVNETSNPIIIQMKYTDELKTLTDKQITN